VTAPRVVVRRRPALVAALLGTVISLPACGASSGGSPSTPSSPTINNTQPLQVNLGVTGDYVNGLFTSVTICVPGTSSCQTIDNVLVDSGSIGLRLLASQVNLQLPRENDAGGNPIANCGGFVGMNFTWGPMAKATVRLAGEEAPSVPIQLIGDPSFPDPPSDCSSGGTAIDTLDSLGARGLLGIGVFRQDCGPGCARTTRIPKIYFACPAAGCTVASVAVESQLQNPVWMFPQDNNGYLISLPSVPELGARTASGSLIFGIGTQPDNALGSAQVYTTDNVGNITTSYNGQSLTGYLDTGSNGLFFLKDADIPFPACPGDDKDFSCPPSTVAQSATNRGSNGTSAPVAFNVANAETLFATNNAALNDLAGSDDGDFDWGLPFFFGRKVFIGIEGQSTPGGTGPYWAY
jgi:uncharacterized protein DUF3443